MIAAIIVDIAMLGSSNPKIKNNQKNIGRTTKTLFIAQIKPLYFLLLLISFTPFSVNIL
jgi:hypothetical protein